MKLVTSFSISRKRLINRDQHHNHVPIPPSKRMRTITDDTIDMGAVIQSFEKIPVPHIDYSEEFKMLWESSESKEVRSRFTTEKELVLRNPNRKQIQRCSIANEYYVVDSEKFLSKSLSFGVIFGSRRILTIYRENMQKLKNAIKKKKKTYTITSPFFRMKTKYDIVNRVQLVTFISSRKNVRIKLEELPKDEHYLQNQRRWKLSYRDYPLKDVASYIDSYTTEKGISIVDRSVQTGLGEGIFLFRHVHGSTEKIAITERNLVVLNRCIFMDMCHVRFNVIYDQKHITFVFRRAGINEYTASAIFRGEILSIDESISLGMTRFIVNNAHRSIPCSVQYIENYIIGDIQRYMASTGNKTIPKIKEIMLVGKSFPKIIVRYYYY